METLDDVFNELGFEAETVEEEIVEIVPEDYTITEFNSLLDEERIEGKPVLTEVMTFTFDDDGEEVERHKAELYILNDDMEEATKININLKRGGDVQENVHCKSQLFALVKGLANLKSPNCMDGYNRIKKVNLEVIRKRLEEMDNIKMEALYAGELNGNSYNTLRILKE